MSFEFLQPVDESVVAHAALLSDQSIGKNLKIHSKKEGMPAFENSQIALIWRGRRSKCG